MLGPANTQVLELEQEVLVLGQTGDRPRKWTATTITGMKIDKGTHYPSCNGRAYKFEDRDHPLFGRESFCRCKHWIIPLDNIGRWAGMPIDSADEMALWFVDHVDSVPEVDDAADLYEYSTDGTVSLMSPFAPGTVTAVTTVAHLILWVAQHP
jgi:hypothetical protein